MKTYGKSDSRISEHFYSLIRLNGVIVNRTKGFIIIDRHHSSWEFKFKQMMPVRFHDSKYIGKIKTCEKRYVLFDLDEEIIANQTNDIMYVLAVIKIHKE